MLIKTADGWRPLLPIFPTRETDRPGKGLKHTQRRTLSPEMQAIADSLSQEQETSAWRT